MHTVSVVSRGDGGRPNSGAVRQVLVGHLGDGADELAVTSGTWAPYDHVNLQVAVDRWLEQQSGGHTLFGLSGFRHRTFGLADLLTEGMDVGLAPGGVAHVEMPIGPNDEVLGCVQCGVYLVDDGEVRSAILMRGTDQRGPQQDVMLEIVSTQPGRAKSILAQLRALAIEHSVYRRQILAFGGEVFGPGRGDLLSFHRRPDVGRADLVLPDGLLEGIERQIIGVAEHREVLLAHGQHLKRGLLLHGAPGVGKTHTVRYLMSRLPDTTVLIISGGAMRLIQEACSIARTLAPALLIIEDVDLVAQERGPHTGFNPLLFQLLNEMDGLGEDIDITFVLTTNRVDVLEPALAARPGRIDHAVEIPLPDEEGRRRLLAVYRGSLELDLAEPERVIERTAGVTASFIKELLRRAALTAAEEMAAADGQSATAAADGETVTRTALRVTDRHLHAVLDVLLDDRNILTRRLLGAQTHSADAQAADSVHAG